jgi:hypothetical protein
LSILKEKKEGGLCDVDRIHEPSHARRIHPLADESPHLILVPCDQFPRRILIPRPQPPHQVIEGGIIFHERGSSKKTYQNRIKRLEYGEVGEVSAKQFENERVEETDHPCFKQKIPTLSDRPQAINS